MYPETMKSKQLGWKPARLSRDWEIPSSPSSPSSPNQTVILISINGSNNPEAAVYDPLVGFG